MKRSAELRALRKSAGLTQQKLADLMGLPRASGRVQVARWEAGTVPLTEAALRHARLVCQSHATPPDALDS